MSTLGIIAGKLTQILVEQLGLDAEQVKPEAHLESDLGADSLDKVELIMAVEEEWGLDIHDEDAEKITTVQHLLDYIQENAE